MIPLILMAAGTAIQVAGQIASNRAQAAAEAKNAAFYEEQARYAKLSALRAEAISEVDWTTKMGQQASAYAGGGAALTGSAGATLGGTLKQAIDDIWAIKIKGDLDVRLANMRMGQSSERAQTLGSNDYNALQAGTTVLSNFSRAYPSSKTTTQTTTTAGE